MRLAMNLKVDGQSPIPIRRQLTEQLKHVIESGGVARDQALPSIRELAGFLGINTNTVARVVEDLKQSGYVEARRGKGVFVASAPPVRPSPHLRELLRRYGDPGRGPWDDRRRLVGGRFEPGRRPARRRPGDRGGPPRGMQPAGARLLCPATRGPPPGPRRQRSEEHTSELQS